MSVSSSRRPVVIVVPGLLFSHLAVEGKRIWLGLRLVGGFHQLAYDPDRPSAVRPDGALDDAFFDLLQHLSRSHRVVMFDNDWRLPLEIEAQRLANQVRAELDAESAGSAPVRLLAQGSAALLVRTLQLEAPAVWDRLLARTGARVLALGPPHLGMWSPLQMLAGDHVFGNALTDFGSPMREMQARHVLAGFPGLLQLQAGLDDCGQGLGNAASWQALAQHAVAADERVDWGLPKQRVLDMARALRRRLDAQDARLFVHPARPWVQVLGCAPATVDAILAEATGVGYRSTADGDGLVPDASARAFDVPTWRAPVEHRSLAASASCFDAYVDLLDTGTTERLPAWTAVALTGYESLAPGGPSAPSAMSAAALPLLDEARLVLVGRGGAGKTSIVDRLVHDRFAPGRAQTDGVEIETWQVAADRRTIRVNVWDFAGQADTHASHQLFISPGSVNMLVLAGGEDTQRRGDDIQRRDAEYWLQLLQAFGTDPTGGLGPVIVVLNQVDRYPLELDRVALAERYPAIVAFVETDCATGRGIATLRGVVEQALAGLPVARRVVPVALRLVRDALEAELTNAPRLPVTRFRALCAAHGVDDAAQQDEFADVFHALGVALSFGG